MGTEENAEVHLYKTFSCVVSKNEYLLCTGSLLAVSWNPDLVSSYKDYAGTMESHLPLCTWAELPHKGHGIHLSRCPFEIQALLGGHREMWLLHPSRFLLVEVRPRQGCGYVAAMLCTVLGRFQCCLVSAWAAHAAGTQIYFLFFLLLGSNFFLLLRLYCAHTLL